MGSAVRTQGGKGILITDRLYLSGHDYAMEMEHVHQFGTALQSSKKNYKQREVKKMWSMDKALYNKT